VDTDSDGNDNEHDEEKCSECVGCGDSDRVDVSWNTGCDISVEVQVLDLGDICTFSESMQDGISSFETSSEQSRSTKNGSKCLDSLDKLVDIDRGSLLDIGELSSDICRSGIRLAGQTSTGSVSHIIDRVLPAIAVYHSNGPEEVPGESSVDQGEVEWHKPDCDCSLEEEDNIEPSVLSWRRGVEAGVNKTD